MQATIEYLGGKVIVDGTIIGAVDTDIIEYRDGSFSRFYNEAAAEQVIEAVFGTVRFADDWVRFIVSERDADGDIYATEVGVTVEFEVAA